MAKVIKLSSLFSIILTIIFCVLNYYLSNNSTTNPAISKTPKILINIA
jgi:hypothetical protein